MQISSCVVTLFLSDVPFENSNYSVKQAFASIHTNSIVCDEGMIHMQLSSSFSEAEEYNP